MKRLPLLFALLLLPLGAAAETVDLGTHGTLSIDLPKGWKIATNATPDVQVAITLTPPDGVNAAGAINIMFAQKGSTAAKADVDDKVLAAGSDYVDSSVEKKKILKKFSVSGDSYGSYCVFTDASLVGKPAQKDNFKMAAIGIVWFNPDVSAAVALASDDENGPDFAAELAAINSMKVTPK
jgi:hypothetical protein